MTITREDLMRFMGGKNKQAPIRPAPKKTTTKPKKRRKKK